MSTENIAYEKRYLDQRAQYDALLSPKGFQFEKAQSGSHPVLTGVSSKAAMKWDIRQGNKLEILEGMEHGKKEKSYTAEKL